MWPHTEEYCSIPEVVGKFSFWFLAIPNAIVCVLAVILSISQFRKGLFTVKRADSNTRALLSLGPLSILTCGFFVCTAIAQLYAPASGYAIKFAGVATVLLWVLSIAYMLIYFQFLAKQVRMNDELRKRFFMKYGRVLRYYMPFHILCIAAIMSVIFVPTDASAYAWDITRAVCMIGASFPQCIIGFYVLPSSMHFSIREIESGLLGRGKSMKANETEDSSNDSTNKIRSLLFRMKAARYTILISNVNQMIITILANAIPGLRFLGGIQLALCLGNFGVIVIVQYPVLLNELGTSLCACFQKRVPNLELSPKKSMVADNSHERSIAAISGVRPASIAPKEGQ
jgi:hypothetical protein